MADPIEYDIDFTADDSEPIEIEMLSDDPIEMDVIDGPVTIQTFEESLIGTINGTNKIFTTTFNYVAGSTRVYINGLKQKLTIHYTESGEKEITFSDAPSSTGYIDELTIEYIKA